MMTSLNSTYVCMESTMDENVLNSDFDLFSPDISNKYHNHNMDTKNSQGMNLIEQKKKEG